MNTWINSEIQDYLANQTELLNLINWKYVRAWEWELFEANVKHLFPDDLEQAKLINPWSYIWSVVYDWVANYVGEPKENMNINYIDLYEWLLTTWYIRFFQNVDTNKLESIKTNKYYYDKDLKKEYFINLYEKIEDYEDNIFTANVNKKYYMLVETFQNWIFERKLFLLNWPANLWVWELRPFDDLEFLKWKAERLSVEWLDRLVIEKQMERPILEKLKTIIFSIEKKLSEIDKNFLNYVEQFKIFRNLEIPENAYKTLNNWVKIVDFDKLWKIIQVNELNWTSGWLDIVRNTNDLLVQSIDYIDKQIKFISAISWVPLFAFGIQNEWWNDSWTSKMKSAWLFYKKIERYRDAIVKLFYEFWENFDIADKDQILEFWEITTSDLNEVVDIQKIMIDGWFQSKRRAIMLIQDTDEKDALRVLEEIKEEDEMMNNQEEIKETTEENQNNEWEINQENSVNI